jgi:peptide/nickel transport system ATP-binding protein
MSEPIGADQTHLRSEPLVEALHLTKSYGKAEVVADVSLSLRRGETLARMILRLVEPTSGSVRFDGIDVMAAGKHDLRRMRRRMQMVFQDPFAALNPRMRIRDIVAEPFHIQGGFSKTHIAERTGELLHEVGLEADVLARYPHEFSGGQRQRINIARALALKPEFLALDEPVSALDVSVGAQVINLLKELQRNHGLTYLFISHSMPLVRYLCDRVAVMERGRLVETGPVLAVCENPREAYTQRLIAATPEMPV